MITTNPVRQRRRPEAPPVEMSVQGTDTGVQLEFHRPVTLVEIPFDRAEQIGRALLTIVNNRPVFAVTRKLERIKREG